MYFPGVSKFFPLWLLALICCSCVAGQEDPWTKAQLIEPAALANQLGLPASQWPVIIDVGPSGLIKGAVEAGPAEEKENLAKIGKLLRDVPRDKEVVIYCGCCPFDKCPNVRPAFRELQRLGFARPRLLNLADNLKKDWIDRGYPLADRD